MNKEIDNLAVNTIRNLSVNMINCAKSGHPGIALGAAPIIHTLFARHLVFDPKNPDWQNRDRFILSAGHGSSMLYAMLHLAGYKVSIEDLKQFRQLGSLTPGHPEVYHTPGVEATTGPLGQGIAMGVGMAIAEENLRAQTNGLIDHYTYVLCGDGCFQEGVAMEACSLAGRLALGKYIILFDSNDIQLDGPTKMAVNEDIKKKFEAMGFDYFLVKDGNDVEAIDKAIKKAKKTSKPSLIEIKTIIGYGSPKAGDAAVHGSPLKEEEIASLNANLNYQLAPFEVSEDVYKLYKRSANKNHRAFKAWKDAYNNSAKLFDKKEFNYDFPVYPLDFSDATRNVCKTCFNIAGKENKLLIGGCADLAKTTFAIGEDGDFDINNRGGRNIRYGVREHAMGAIVNGLTLSGMRGFGGGFFVFSDYLKPAIRLAALMNIPSLFIFSHNSIMVGEDGPTHQPIEHFAMLRSIPNLNVFNPCDANEFNYAFKYYLNHNNPTVITSTRQKVSTLANTSYESLSKGGYIIAKETAKLEGIIIAAGSEVELALKAKEQLGNGIRVVSMPSMFLFDKQSEKYQNEVLPKGVKVAAIELAHPMPWYKYTPNVFGVSRFGLSAKPNDAIKALGFDVEHFVQFYNDIK